MCALLKVLSSKRPLATSVEHWQIGVKEFGDQSEKAWDTGELATSHLHYATVRSSSARENLPQFLVIHICGQVPHTQPHRANKCVGIFQLLHPCPLHRHTLLQVRLRQTFCFFGAGQNDCAENRARIFDESHEYANSKILRHDGK